MSTTELPTDRLSTADKAGNRIYVYPADVEGRFRTKRIIVNSILMVVFLGLPWIKMNGYPAILLNISKKLFIFFGIPFWAHDVPLLVFLVGGAILTLTLVTVIFGRVWCGWACPQTVFIDSVFRKIERWVEGEALIRKKLDDSPWSVDKAKKKTIKWTLYIAMSMLVSHSFLAYFVGVDELHRMIMTSPFENQGSFLFMVFVTSLILFDFAWFREQFCILVCPYGRLQSVLMDDCTTVVHYDAARGEPRKGTPEKSTLGDCVNCFRCVRVCPTGIDIRRGVQMECIACTACMDACDDVMGRLKKPLGLIRYESLTPSVVQKWYQREKVLIIGSLLLICVFGLVYSLLNRSVIDIAVLRAVDTPFQEMILESGEKGILNHFRVHIRNQSAYSQKIQFIIPNPEIRIVTSNHPAQLAPGAAERADLFIEFPKKLLKQGSATIPIQIESIKDSIQTNGSALVQEGAPVRLLKEIKIVGPF